MNRDLPASSSGYRRLARAVSAHAALARAGRSFAILAALLAATTLVAGHADAAPFKWRDAEGRLVYSDLPPPPGARVQMISAPADGRPVPVAAPAQASASAPAPATADESARADAPAAPTSWVERERAARQQAAERAAVDAKVAERDRQAAERMSHCEQARNSLATLESGVRLRMVNARGEPIVIDDAERAKQAAAIQRTLAEHCGRQPS